MTHITKKMQFIEVFFTFILFSYSKVYALTIDEVETRLINLENELKDITDYRIEARLTSLGNKLDDIAGREKCSIALYHYNSLIQEVTRDDREQFEKEKQDLEIEMETQKERISAMQEAFEKKDSFSSLDIRRKEEMKIFQEKNSLALSQERLENNERKKQQAIQSKFEQALSLAVAQVGKNYTYDCCIPVLTPQGTNDSRPYYLASEGKDSPVVVDITEQIVSLTKAYYQALDT